MENFLFDKTPPPQKKTLVPDLVEYVHLEQSISRDIKLFRKFWRRQCQ